MELVGPPGAVGRLLALLGPADPARARAAAPESVRARYGVSAAENAVHASDSPQAAVADAELFFSPQARASGARGALRSAAPPARACCVHTADTSPRGAQVASAVRGGNTTLAVIKPSAVTGGAAGALLAALQSQFDITGALLLSVDRQRAAQFHEVYKGVVPEYGRMVEELTAGPALALEVSQRLDAPPNAESVVQQLREAAGPADPELARVLRPHSLRARFGNALHVTDLESDAPTEVAFFFGTPA